jgi:hypothetical protein
VYHPSFKSRFLKDHRHVRQYAFPAMATGTIILTIGMLICSAVVEKSTKEKVFVVTEKYRQLNSKDSSKKQTFRILWLQKSDIVGDQTFDSSIIFGRNQIDKVLTSRRKDPKDDRNGGSNDDSNEDTECLTACLGRILSYSRRMLSRGEETLSPANRITVFTTQKFTTLGVVLGLSGFILQFQVD